MASIAPSERENAALLGNKQQSAGACRILGLLLVVAVIGTFAVIIGLENRASSVTPPPLSHPTAASEGHSRPPNIDVKDLPFPHAPNDIFPTAFLQKLQPPFPTHAFWFNMAIYDGIGPAVLLPYAIKCLDQGVMVSYPAARRTVTVTTESDYFQNDIGFSTVEAYSSRYVTDYDEFSVTMQFEVEAQGSYKTIAVRGCPYATILYDNVTPVITSDWSNVTTVNGEAAAGAVVSGKEFLLEQQDGMRWWVFFSDSVELTVSEDGESLVASELFTGVVRTAMSPDTSSDELLKTYAYSAYPTGGIFNYTVENDTVTYSYRWLKEGDGPLLMGSVKHLSDIMHENTTFVSTGMYQCMKGPVDLIEGDSWTLQEELPKITWYAPRRITDKEKLAIMMEQLSKDVAIKPPNDFNPYFAGKVFARMARIALIAEEYNATDIQWTAVGILEDYMTKWLTGNNFNKLVYETNYGGVVTEMGINSWKADFGSGWYNDHHFHYGYFLYTLAVIIKMDSTYYEANEKAINFILGDIGTREYDSAYFPFARHKDFYDHHSWALGLFQTFDGKSQESSSESVNAYYGMWLLGLAIEDNDLADWGRVLLAMELRGTHYYWQVHEGNEAIYDNFFAANKMVGQIGGLDAFCQTWFGDELEYIHGIQMLPYTPITEELLSYDYVLTEWPVVKTALSNPEITPAWTGILYLDFAIIDPSAAWDLMTSLDSNSLDDGFSMANSMYWILTREDHGYYDVNTTAAPQVVYQSCEINQGCYNRGYTTGNCCPTDDGTYMDCCPVTS